MIEPGRVECVRCCRSQICDATAIYLQCINPFDGEEWNYVRMIGQREDMEMVVAQSFEQFERQIRNTLRERQAA